MVMKKYLLLLFVIFSSCQSPGDEAHLNQEFKDAVKNNDTALANALANKIAQEYFEKLKTVPDSIFTTLTDVGLRLHSLELDIEKINTASANSPVPDSLITSNEKIKILYTYMMKVYERALKKTIQKSDFDYYSQKLAVTSEIWANDNFKNKTKKELQISRVMLQKDIAVASAIIYGIDSKETRKQIEYGFNNSIRFIKEGHL